MRLVKPPETDGAKNNLKLSPLVRSPPVLVTMSVPARVSVPLSASLNEADSDTEPTKGYTLTANDTPYADVSNSILFAILKLVGNEVHAPSFHRSGRLELLLAMAHGLAPPCRLYPLQCQPFFLVQPVHQMLAHFPAFAVQKHADLAISIAHSCLSDLADPHPQLSPWIAVAAVAVSAASHA